MEHRQSSVKLVHLRQWITKSIFNSMLPAVQPFYDEWSELIGFLDLIFPNEQLEVTPLLRKDILNQRHSSHTGTGGNVRRAPEMLY